MNKFLRYQFPVLFWTVAIFIVSSIPSLATPDLGFNLQDKVYHFIEFGIFGFLVIRALHFSEITNLRKHYVILAVLISICYSAFDELHQWFVPGRFTDFGDFVADVLGALFAQGMYYSYNSFVLKTKQVKYE